MRTTLRHTAFISAMMALVAAEQASAAETVTKTTKTTETSDGETKTEETTTVEEDHGGEGATKTNRRHHGDWIIREYAHHDRPMQLDVSIGPLYFDGVGAAVWYSLPIVPDGFIRPINDSFDIEFGLVFGGRWGYAFYNDAILQYGPVFSLVPLVGVRWNFFLTPAWSVFASLKFGAEIDVGYGAAFAAAGTVGAIWKFSDWIGLRLEAGYPLPISVGLSFDLGSM